MGIIANERNLLRVLLVFVAEQLDMCPMPAESQQDNE